MAIKEYRARLRAERTGAARMTAAIEAAEHGRRFVARFGGNWLAALRVASERAKRGEARYAGIAAYIREVYRVNGQGESR